MTTKEFKIQYALGSLSVDDLLTLAYSFNTSKCILTQLSEDKRWNIRSWVAENRNTPIKVLEELAKDEETHVLYWLVENPNTPIKVLEKLSKDENLAVKRHAAVYLNNRRVNE